MSLWAVLFPIRSILGWLAFHHALLYLVPLTLVIVGYVVLYLRLTRAHERAEALLHELEAAHGALANYAARVEELTLANERQRLARELHDTLAQGLVRLTMQLDAVDALLSEENLLGSARDCATSYGTFPYYPGRCSQGHQ
jgi:signal transduction histidine kinase